MYKARTPCPLNSLFRPDMLQLLGGVKEVVRVGFGRELARVGLLNEVLVALLLGEVDGVLLGLEVDVSPLHEVGGRLPSHQRVLPSVTLRKNVPVHSPALPPEVAGLRRRLRFFVDSAGLSAEGMAQGLRWYTPDSPGLELHWGARNDGCGEDVLAPILNCLRHGRESTSSCVSPNARNWAVGGFCAYEVALSAGAS